MADQAFAEFTMNLQSINNDMGRAYSVANVFDAKFRVLEFDGIWRDAVGCPELTGSWFIYGPPKNGKTSLAMMLAKYLTRFRRVGYDSIEEGLSLSIREAMHRVKMKEVKNRFMLIEKETVPELIERLSRHKSPDVIFIDSVQFMELKFSEYKRLKAQFPQKLFVYVSHIEGKQPQGATAKRIWRDANVSIRVEGFKAFPVGRYGGGEPVVISKKLADDYWGLG
jgi:nucleoside-triphosphatase THEP1